MSACLNLLTLQSHPLKETVFPCCVVSLGQSTQTRDIKWGSGKEGVNILSNAKVSRAGGEFSQLPGLPNAFALLRFLLGSVQGHTEHRLSVAGQQVSFPSNFTLHHSSSGPKMQTDTAALHPPQFCFLKRQRHFQHVGILIHYTFTDRPDFSHLSSIIDMRHSGHDVL